MQLWSKRLKREQQNMLQLSRRSTGHKPFLTCDDPIMGVVECARIRNPQKNPTHKKIKTHSKKKKLEIEGAEEQICSKEMTFGRGKEEAQTPISFQLMEVSSEEASDERVLDSSDVPSTCSSQSSAVCSNESSPSLVASLKKNHRKPKCLNLMVKLMSLEYAFPRSLSSSPGNHVNEKRPEFDLDSPREMKHELHCKKSDWRRTLIKMIEAVKLRVFKSSLVKRVNYSSNSSFSCLHLEHPITPKTRGELDMESEERPSYMRIRSNPLAQEYQNEKMRRVKVDASLIKNLSREFGSVDDNAIKVKSEVKEAKAEEKASTPAKTRRRKKLVVQKKADKAENEIRRTNEEMDAYCDDENQSCLVCEIKFSSTHEVETANDHPSNHINRVRENRNSVDHDGSMEAFQGDNNLKDLLLSSPGFVKSVEELFDVNMNLNRELQQAADDKILLDVASEIMEFYGSQYLRTHLPFQWTRNMSLKIYDHTCLELLLDEVCDWIKDLQCYKKVVENDLSDDSLVLLVKGDLSSRRMGIGVWDIGWSSAGSADDFEEIVREIEELVLSGLIEELALKQFHVYK